MRKRHNNRSERLAGAAVEMAVVTPLLLTLLFGIMEYGWVFTIRQGLVTAAREGARLATMPGTTDAEIKARVQEVLEPFGLSEASAPGQADGYTCNLTRADPDDPTQNTEVVQLTIPYSRVTLIGIGNWLGTSDYILGSTCSMNNETQWPDS